MEHPRTNMQIFGILQEGEKRGKRYNQQALTFIEDSPLLVEASINLLLYVTARIK
jgi:hypothetical protein